MKKNERNHRQDKNACNLSLMAFSCRFPPHTQQRGQTCSNHAAAYGQQLDGRYAGRGDCSREPACAPGLRAPSQQRFDAASSSPAPGLP